MIFLRPWALLLLIVPFLMKGFHHFIPQKTPWDKFIDKTLLPSLLVKQKTAKLTKIWSWQMGILWFLWTVALAGPAFQKLPAPAVESAPNTIIVFDLSIQGKELLQAQAKLYDLLSALHGERVGLVLFGQNQGYTAMPLTPDTDLIKEIVPTLVSDVLPEPATNPKVGFDYATELLDNAGGKGRILFVSNKIEKWNGPYPFGELNIQERTADDGDIQKLLKETKTLGNTIDATFSATADTWADLGGWFVFVSLPFFALMFRKGILFFFFLGFAFQGEASFFWRPEQEVYKDEKAAIEAYNKKDYQTAISLFQQSGNLYNLGNALAFSGDIQGAIAAYAEELKKNPENEDARFNKEYLEKQLPPPEEQKQKTEENQSENNQDNSDQNNEENQEPEQNKEENSDESQNQSEENDSEKFQENQSDSQPTQDETQEQLEQALVEYEKESPYNQEEQQILNRLNHDPSRVLRYRLLLQHQKGQMK